MELGDIIVLALGGYAFVARFLLTRDRTARWNGYEMLFACGIAGILLLVLTVPIAKVAYSFVDFWPKGTSVWSIAGVLGIPVGFLLASVLNRFPRMEETRLRQLRSVALSNSDLIEVLFDDAMGGRRFVELVLETGKCYVGLPVRIAYARFSELADVELTPIFSGYRTKEKQALRLTNYLGRRLKGNPPDRLSAHDFRVVIPLRQVVSARLFDPVVDLSEAILDDTFQADKPS